MLVIIIVVVMVAIAEIVALACWFSLPFWWQQYVACRHALEMQTLLARLPFNHELLVGRDRHHESSVAGNARVYADATYTLLVQQGNAYVGLIGFELKRDLLLVIQLQGIKGANVRGIDLADFLLSAAEEIARTLGVSEVRVRQAEYNAYYHLEAEHPLYHDLRKHQLRLERIYNIAPQKRGYALASGWFDKCIA